MVAAAIELADRDGIGSIGMRRLAQEPGVEAMSLYTHVRNKDDLLDGMVDAVISKIPTSAGGADWKASLRQMALAARGAVLPYIAEMALAVTRGGALGRCDDDAEFEFALDFILDGLDRLRGG